jgi:acyl carrier protein
MFDVSTVKTFIINNYLFGNGSKLEDNSVSFLDTGIMDSTGILELISFLEETYSININDDEMLPENLDSLANLEAFIGRKMAG